LELAENGTLLLNEVGELDLSLQAKLLTFLDTRKFLRVGGEKSITVNSRIVAATNRDLAAAVERGEFRQDLYYRLDVFSIHIPPLRERERDIDRLVAELVQRLSTQLALPSTPEIEDKALVSLKKYYWPGNVRELRNVIERALIICKDGVIRATDLRLPGESKAPPDWHIKVPFTSGKNLHQITQYVARRLIDEALLRSETKAEAARLLGISRDSLNYQMKSLGLNV
jgi:transcriptional regulator with PAS, ATPase and Fis domain